ncbi:IS21-like element helper ATPase IstB [Candidatus Pacearchaeota archaeon]|nr:IS21-like element helper ATPase IstB [Candidatus Pacearchaeota archaeon]
MAKKTNLQDDINSYLKELRLSAIREYYVHAADKAREESLSYEAFLLDIVEQECIKRRNNRIERILRVSKLPLAKNIESFDLKKLPNKVTHYVKTLLEGSFLDNKENVLAFGNPGSGKTHLLCAIGQELIRKGNSVYFSSCSMLVQELLLAKQELRLPNILKKLAKFDAIIIDDIGYVQQKREEMEILFTLLAERYERGSIMITSNLPFSKWEKIFKDPMVTAAAIDRLVHHCVILELNIPSYRMAQAKNKKNHEKIQA